MANVYQINILMLEPNCNGNAVKVTNGKPFLVILRRAIGALIALIKEVMINTHEKESIEKQVAEEFLLLFNQKFKTNFVVEEHRDKPDFFCIDKASNQELLLEITLLEDVKGDLRFILGRGEKPMPKGRAKGFYPATSFNDDTLVQIIERIKDKSMKDYGSNVALVIRQATSIPWDWNVELEVIRSKIHDLNNPFDKGRWILSSFGNIYCID